MEKLYHVLSSFLLKDFLLMV